MWREESILARNLRPLKQQSSELFLFLCYLPQQKLAFSRKGAAQQDRKLLNEHCAPAKYHTEKTVAQSPAMEAGAQVGSLDFHPHEAIIRCQPLPWGGVRDFYLLIQKLPHCGVKGDHVESWNFRPCPVRMLSNAQ